MITTPVLRGVFYYYNTPKKFYCTCPRWASAAAGLMTLVLFMPGIFSEHNVHVGEKTQNQNKGDTIF
jgi:hypothetical protein